MNMEELKILKKYSEVRSIDPKDYVIVKILCNLGLMSIIHHYATIVHNVKIEYAKTTPDGMIFYNSKKHKLIPIIGKFLK